MTFVKGKSGNVNWRPAGAQNLLTTELRARLLPVFGMALETLAEALRAGDVKAAMLVVDKILPDLRPVAPPLPPIPLKAGATAAEKGQRVVEAMMDGLLSPEDCARALGALRDLRELQLAEDLPPADNDEHSDTVPEEWLRNLLGDSSS